MVKGLAALLVVGALVIPAITLAQSPPAVPMESKVLCVRADVPVDYPITASTLTGGIRDGVVQVTSVVECPDTTVEPTVQPSAAPVAGDPVPIEVVDSGFTDDRGDTPFAQWAVILRNPNASGWMATEMPVSIDFIDANGDILSTTDSYVTLAPGQTSALADTEFDAGDTASLEVRVANDADQWVPVDGDASAYTLDLSQVKTRLVDGQPVTTGRVTNHFTSDLEDVPIAVVYWNKAGKVIGGESTYVDRLPEGGTAAFKADGFTTYRNLGKHEVFWEVPLN
jgi:hypothetical protein